MKVLKDKFQRYIEKISYVEDPIEAAKDMISSIQRCVGIRNVFGDEKRSATIFSAIVTLLFASTFIYVGTISQLIYLVQVFPDKIESFKAIN